MAITSLLPKLPSNASKEWSGKFDDLKIKKENLERKGKEAIREHREADKQEGKTKSGGGDRLYLREKRILSVGPHIDGKKDYS